LVFGDGLGQFSRGEESVFEGENERPGVHQFKLHGCGQIAEGQTNLATLRSGQLMPLSGHPCVDWNRLWLLTHVEHRGGQEPGLPYSNQLRAVVQEVPFVADHSVLKPRMHSLQRAWVVEVDESQPDLSRPVAVQFDWLYQGEGAAPSHCWLPLAPELGDAGSLPLCEGAQVLVSFIEGDPDQPLISGFLPGAASSTEPVIPDLQPSLVTDANLALDGLLGMLQSSEPLVLLCLLPGGGSFSHCTQSFCTCRVVTQFGQSGAA
jgi:type VI secretion system secreted protein VgrG